MTEEPSAGNFLRVILPKILPEDYALDINCFIRTHEGKNDLQKSIKNKIKAWPHWGRPVKVLVIHDQDANDCEQLKSSLLDLFKGTPTPAVIRIACRELENWYLGDLDAVEAVYPATKASSLKAKAKYRNPDNLSGANEMRLLTSDFSKSHASKTIPKHMNINNNNSASFNHLISGVQKLIAL